MFKSTVEVYGGKGGRVRKLGEIKLKTWDGQNAFDLEYLRFIKIICFKKKIPIQGLDVYNISQLQKRMTRLIKRMKYSEKIKIPVFEKGGSHNIFLNRSYYKTLKCASNYIKKQTVLCIELEDFSLFK